MKLFFDENFDGPISRRFCRKFPGSIYAGDDAKEIAAELQREDPSISAPDHVAIRRFLKKRNAAISAPD
ncbi:MAG: hypothetical protein AABY98_02695 [Candidatus Deferrimicrobiota bacterium]